MMDHKGFEASYNAKLKRKQRQVEQWRRKNGKCNSLWAKLFPGYAGVL